MALLNILLTPLKKNYFPKQSGWLFLALFLLMSFFYNYHHILFKPMQSLHRWRQADCLSITMNYYQDNNPLLEPSMHALGNGTGKAVSEFPIIYYSVAKLWKLFGKHEYIYRSLILLSLFAGLFFLFRRIETLLQDSIVGIFIPLLLFTSPVMAYYGANYVLDITSLALALIGLSLFLKFCDTASSRSLYISMACYAFAGLLKITSLVSFGAIVGIFCLERIHVSLLPGRKIFTKPWLQLLPMGLVMIIQVIWYSYAKKYNSINPGIFLLEIKPIWKIPYQQFLDTLAAVKEHAITDYFQLGTGLLWVAALILVVLNFKKLTKTFNLILGLTTIACLSFMVLFFEQFRYHDYYITNILILVPLVFLGLFQWINKQYPKFYWSIAFRVCILLFLVNNIYFAKESIEFRYNPDGWINSEYIHYLKPYEQIGPYLRSLGIHKNDRVISLSDESVNITLYMMNQKGWTRFNVSTHPNSIPEKINMGAKYIFVHNSKTYEEKAFKPFLKNRIGTFKNIDIYAL